MIDEELAYELHKAWCKTADEVPARSMHAMMAGGIINVEAVLAVTRRARELLAAPAVDALAQVRADIDRTARVVSALAADLELYGDETPSQREFDEEGDQAARLRALLARERELLAEAGEAEGSAGKGG